MASSIQRVNKVYKNTDFKILRGRFFVFCFLFFFFGGGGAIVVVVDVVVVVVLLLLLLLLLLGISLKIKLLKSLAKLDNLKYVHTKQ